MRETKHEYLKTITKISMDEFNNDDIETIEKLLADSDRYNFLKTYIDDDYNMCFTVEN